MFTFTHKIPDICDVKVEITFENISEEKQFKKLISQWPTLLPPSVLGGEFEMFGNPIGKYRYKSDIKRLMEKSFVENLIKFQRAIDLYIYYTR